jgi:glutaredoxin
MKKNVLIAGAVIFIAILGYGLWFWSGQTQSEANLITSDVVLFYGKECPHCKDVEKFLAENKIAEKVKFDYLEIWYNKKNATLLQEKALECGVKKEEIGVPFLYSNGQCFIGAPDIEKFFQDKEGSNQ